MQKAKIILIISLLLATSSQAKEAHDLTRLGVGARALGMGKAFVAVADDINSLFLNPAGLAQIDKWQLTSMSGKFINEINYLQVGGIYPTRLGNFGIGYIGSGLNFMGAAVTTETVGGNTRVIESTTETGSYNYNTSVLLLSYGRALRQNLSFGINLKLFSQGLTAVAGGSASGSALDIGLLFKPKDFLSLGINQQNINGEVTWPNLKETIASVTKIGAAWQVRENLKWALDADFSSGLPTLWHLGLEHPYNKFFTFRAGIDQDAVGQGVSNNLTLGTGIVFRDFTFDYAFRQQAVVPGADSHYFSLSYKPQLSKE